MKIKSVVKKALQYLGLLGIFWKFIAVNNARKNKKLYKSLVSFYFNFKPREFNEAYEVLCDERQVNKSLNRYKKHAELFIISVLKPCLTKQDMENQEIGVVLKEFYGDELASDLSKAFNTLEVECPLKNACTRESSPLEQLISSLKKTMPQKEKRLTLVKILIQVLIDDGRVPKFYELDYIDNIEGMIKGLYPTNAGVMIKQSNNFLSALSSLSFSADYKPNLNWSEKLRNLGISGEEFKPHVSKSANSYVKEVMPDQYDSF